MVQSLTLSPVVLFGLLVEALLIFLLQEMTECSECLSHTALAYWLVLCHKLCQQDQGIVMLVGMGVLVCWDTT